MANKGTQHPPALAHMPIIHPQAAGIHVGAEEPWGGPAARATPPVQTCSAFPCALYRLADGLTACRLPTIGMASTGVYGRPRLQSRAARGLAVAWGHARHATHGPGRPRLGAMVKGSRGSSVLSCSPRRCGPLRPSVRSGVWGAIVTVCSRWRRRLGHRGQHRWPPCPCLSLRGRFFIRY